MESPTPKTVVRPGRVDDLAFAITKRVVAVKAPPFVQEVFLEAESIIKAVYTRYLGKIHFPGVPRTRDKGKRKKVDHAH
jgi:hypothetical protein